MNSKGIVTRTKHRIWEEDIKERKIEKIYLNISGKMHVMGIMNPFKIKSTKVIKAFSKIFSQITQKEE